MCGLPLLYLKKCGHNLTPRFLALGKPCIYISIYLSIYLSCIVPYIDLSIYRGWQEKSQIFFFFFFFFP